MSKPEDIRDDAMGIAVSIEKDIPSRVTGANRVFIRAVIARAIMAAEKRGEERALADNGWFERQYPTAIASGDWERVARLLSGRLRQMDKRARAANLRADSIRARSA